MPKGERTPGGVTVQVKGKNLTITPALHDQVVHKLSKLDKYLDRLQVIDVELCAEHTRDAAHHNHVEATTHVRGRTIRVAADDSDMYAAIDGVVDKLYRQLNRHKERLKAHHGPALSEAIDTESAEPAAEEDEGPTIHVERLEVKPQFEEEAISDMEELGRAFFVFLNARNEQVNVVYRRPDGSYGLIQPRIG